MSTRYVWSKGTVEYVDMMPHAYDTGGTNISQWRQDLPYIPHGTFSGSTTTTDQPQCWRSYTFDKSTGKYTGSGDFKDLTALTGQDMSVGALIKSVVSPSNIYPYIISNDQKSIYLWDERDSKTRWPSSGVVESNDDVYWTRFASGKNSKNNHIPSSANNCICISMTDQDKSGYDYYALGIIRINAVESTSSERVSSNNSGAYSGSGYTYLGSDNIDPLSISYPTTGKNPGDSIEITVSPRSNTYGGIISYQYQYNTGSGWVTIQTTTATSIQFTIPSNASSIQFRARAQDNWGFTSDDYVTGPKITFDGGSGGGDIGKVWVGVNNTAKQATGIWVGVNGVAKKATAMWVGVNGVAKKVF